MQKKSNKIFAACLAASVAMSVFPTVSVLAAEPVPPSVPRYWGADRYETAIAISKAGWTGKSEYAVIARGDDYADALCAAPLAKLHNAPILLTQKDQLNTKVKDELKRLGVTKVIITGGTNAISSSVEAELKAFGSVERVQGADRYETSVNIAKKLGTSSQITLATGSSYADAISVAPAAAAQRMPILLTGKDGVPASVKAYIDGNEITQTYIIGGASAISSDVEKAVPAAKRIAGNDRYETNIKVMSQFASILNFDKVYAAAGDGQKHDKFADALAGAALAAQSSSPVVLTAAVLPQGTKDYISGQLAPKSTVVLLGGESAVASSVAKAIAPAKEDFSTAEKVYGSANANAPQQIGSNANMDGDKVTLQNANVKGNVYVYGNEDSLSNVTVSGIVFVDPGEQGSVTLDHVRAAAIRIKSGAQNSIHLKDVNADALVVESKNAAKSVRIETSGSTAIENTVINSAVILDAASGSFGTVQVSSAGQADKTVELRGTFDKDILVTGQAVLQAAEGAQIPKVQVAPSNADTSVSFQGKFKAVELKSAGNLEIGAGAEITSVKVAAKAEIKADKTAKVASVEVATKKNEEIKLDGKFETITLTSAAKIDVASGSEIAKIEAVKGVEGTVNIPKDAEVKEASDNLKTSGEGASSVTVIPAPEQPSVPDTDTQGNTGGVIGGNTGGTTGGNTGGQTTYVTITSITNAVVQNGTIRLSSSPSNISGSTLQVSEPGSKLQLKVTKGSTTTTIGTWNLSSSAVKLASTQFAAGLDPLNTFTVLKNAGLDSTALYDAVDLSAVINAVKGNTSDSSIVYDDILPLIFDHINAVSSTQSQTLYNAVNLPAVYAAAEDSGKTGIEQAFSSAVAVAGIPFSSLVSGNTASVIDTINRATYRDAFYQAIDFAKLFDAVSSSQNKRAMFDAMNLTQIFNSVKNSFTNTDMLLAAATLYTDMSRLSEGTKTVITNSIHVNTFLQALINKGNQITLTVTGSDNDANRGTTYTVTAQ